MTLPIEHPLINYVWFPPLLIRYLNFFWKFIYVLVNLKEGHTLLAPTKFVLPGQQITTEFIKKNKNELLQLAIIYNNDHESMS